MSKIKLGEPSFDQLAAALAKCIDVNCLDEYMALRQKKVKAIANDAKRSLLHFENVEVAMIDEVIRHWPVDSRNDFLVAFVERKRGGELQQIESLQAAADGLQWLSIVAWFGVGLCLAYLIFK